MKGEGVEGAGLFYDVEGSPGISQVDPVSI